MKKFTYWDFLGLISVVFIIEMYAIELIIKINNMHCLFYIAKIFMMIFIMYGIMYLIGIVSQTGYELDKKKWYYMAERNKNKIYNIMALLFGFILFLSTSILVYNRYYILTSYCPSIMECSPVSNLVGFSSILNFFSVIFLIIIYFKNKKEMKNKWNQANILKKN